MNVPFLDLRAHHHPLRGEFSRVIEEVIDESAFSGARFVDRFEKQFARYCGTRHAVGVGSGTEALWLTLLAMGIGSGDEVITVPNTFVATVEAISNCGAQPVFVDVDEFSYALDPARLEEAITPRTKAIIPVHLFGQPANMDLIMEIARRHGLFVVEDAAQAHGARYKGRKAGSLADAGCFSFYPGKNLGAFGDAGAVVTDNPELSEKIRMLRDHGQIEKYHHAMIGWNGRMDDIQAVVLGIKLRHLDAHNQKRRTHALHYDEELNGLAGVVVPARAADVLHAYHIYAIRVRERDEIKKVLSDEGVECGIHYPIPIHLQGAYRYLGHAEGAFPVAERCAQEFLSLPMFPELTLEQLNYVATGVRGAIKARLAA